MSEVDAFIKHYGVKGMKWGVRRSDRELARAQRRRESSTDAKQASKAQKKAKKKGISSLSNHELQILNKRLQLEQQFSNLDNKESVSIGKKFADEAVKMSANIAREQFKNQANRKIAKMLDSDKPKKSKSDRAPDQYAKLLRKP